MVGGQSCGRSLWLATGSYAVGSCMGSRRPRPLTPVHPTAEQDGGPPGRGHPRPPQPRRGHSGGRARTAARPRAAGLRLCWRCHATGRAACWPGECWVRAGRGVGWGQASTDNPPRPQVGGSHSEDGLSSSGGLVHNHVALPDLSRPPDSYSGKSLLRPLCRGGCTPGWPMPWARQ